MNQCRVPAKALSVVWTPAFAGVTIISVMPVETGIQTEVHDGSSGIAAEWTSAFAVVTMFVYEGMTFFRGGGVIRWQWHSLRLPAIVAGMLWSVP
ncbi:hypothetical protein B6S09_12885 [Oceanimonas baumannii]|uniref:Uncharacterized protein n=1 Tax=Oceanimonas baumannii TaxID=129578 RepID=A0A235CG53_9GAMM|nr:hypothetical protein B6S09_12885 [Oceanimonas baumannii]TDW58501.1 hypothetical protein LY04_02278 [Oceanimonas baumannii]